MKPTKEQMLEFFPIGSRVRLVRMEDPHAPAKGTKGTVTGVDDILSVHVNWDNGSTLAVIYGEDICARIDIGEASKR